MNQEQQTNSFHGLGIAPKLLQILDAQGFVTPTPIQRQSIPAAISGKDLIGIAQTGTGKTLAFGIPMLQRLAITKRKGLILLPTRELAMQVNESLTRIGKSLGLNTAVVIGGESQSKQIAAIKKNPHIIIATPGRLIDLLDQKAVSLSQIGVLVLDEADRMLDMGFAPQLKRIMPHLPENRQTMLFSATMDDEVTDISASFLKIPVRIEVAPAGTTVNQITQEIIIVNKPDKPSLLLKVLSDYTGSTLVFCRTKHGAKKVTRMIQREGTTAAEIHSNRSLNQRLEALQGFKIGKYRVLVATDIAARGIDVSGIELVVNFDLPEQAADYVHRIGRTARAGKTGHAISFATADQRSDIRAIERLIQKSLPVRKESGALSQANEPESEMLHPQRRQQREMRPSSGMRGRTQGRNREHAVDQHRQKQLRNRHPQRASARLQYDPLAEGRIDYYLNDAHTEPEQRQERTAHQERPQRNSRGGFSRSSRPSAQRSDGTRDSQQKPRGPWTAPRSKRDKKFSTYKQNPPRSSGRFPKDRSFNTPF